MAQQDLGKKRTPSQEIANRFEFHPATDVTGPQHDAVRSKFGNLAKWVHKNVPEGRHQSLALTELQNAMMWCNAAIACDTEDS